MLKKGKPIVEAEVLRKKYEEREKKKKDGKWCTFISPREEGFICLETPSMGVFKEPCTGEDMSSCYFLRNGKG